MLTKNNKKRIKIFISVLFVFSILFSPILPVGIAFAGELVTEGQNATIDVQLPADLSNNTGITPEQIQKESPQSDFVFSNNLVGYIDPNNPAKAIIWAPPASQPDPSLEEDNSDSQPASQSTSDINTNNNNSGDTNSGGATSIQDIGTPPVIQSAPTVPSNIYCPNGGDISSYQKFVEAKGAGLISFGIVADTNSATVNFSNQTGCTIPMSLSVYKMFVNQGEQNWLSTQQLFDNTGIINATSSTFYKVNLPSCMAQIDFWYGLAPTTLLDSNPYGGPTPPVVVDYKFASNSLCSNVVVNTPPTITLIGANPFNLIVGTPFVDPGATATDTEDGVLTSQIVRTGTVNASTTGTYILTYVVKDSGNLYATTTRTVIVSPPACESNCDDGGGPPLPPPPASININVVASKIVCNLESDLPNWGAGGPDITSSTTSQFLNSHPGCHLEPNWKFQWANVGTPDPGATFTGEANGWNTFGPTNQQGIATTTISVSSSTPYVWAREVLKSNYLTFTYPGNNSSTSAEMYCHTDVLNYDNYDRIDSPFISGSTYYCVAFNVASTTTPPVINTPPTITLIGANPFNLTVGTPFVDPGATATDTEDGVLTSQIVRTGTVNASTTGTYILTYVVKDSGNLYATTTRTVVVSATTTPPISPPVNPSGGGGGGGGGIGGHRHPIGEVLGATSCSYLRDYLKIDWKNDLVEVLKLQSFLNIYEKENLPLTGVFDQATFGAVERFQNKYKSDILTPWGHDAPTGFVYILTKKKINEIYCNTAINLSQADKDEIDAFRAFLESNPNTNVSGQVGFSSGSGAVSVSDNIQSTSRSGVLKEPPLVELKDNQLNPSVLRNAAVSLFALPQKIFSNWKYFIIFLILLAIIIAVIRSIIGSKDSDDTPDSDSGPMAPEAEEASLFAEEPTEKEESPVIILPGVSDEVEKEEMPSALPDEEIVIENPEEEPEETVQSSPGDTEEIS